MFPSTPINQPNPLDWPFDMFYEEVDTPSIFIMEWNTILIGYIGKIIFFSKFGIKILIISLNFQWDLLELL